MATLREKAMKAGGAITYIPGLSELLASGGYDNAVGDPARLAKAYVSSVWAYRCVTIRAQTLAGIPWDVLAGDKPAGDEDPLRVVLNMGASELPLEDLWRATESDMLIYGYGYWAKQRPPRSNAVRGLLRLNPATMEVVADTFGIQGFVQRINGKKVAEFEREEMVYFRDYHPTDDLGGLSPLQIALASVDAGAEAAQFLAAFFANYALPPVLLTSEQSLGDKAIEQARRWWDRLFRGSSNQHKVGIMGGGLKPTILGYPLGDIAMTEVQDSIRREICAAFGVPPAIAGAWEAANFASAESQRQALYEDVVIPRARYLQGVLNRDLAPDCGPSRFAWKLDELDVMQPDRESEARIHALLVQSGIEDPAAAAVAMNVKPRTTPLEPDGASTDNLPQVSPVRSAATDPTPDELRAVDLAKWERKALKRLRAGKAAACEFQSEYIPEALAGAVLGGLEDCEAAGDVREVFVRAGMWSEYP